ncbi:ribonuclease P protein subunit p38 isoform X1 [Hemiscyllium ocellatum]|uniref:ribonuclease P protein subunit p38 isoform X1 n=2 Tax=Hemiscyllium ocellatum TaxID=170820 RepID=UPI002966C508|nr:ribonuclease P protein subunit p38 isoform X1 [Hemiscyllium ocellatum]
MWVGKSFEHCSLLVVNENMESPAQVAKGKGVRKAKLPSVKTSFNNPYSIEWIPLEKNIMTFILENLTKAFQETGLCKVEPIVKPRKPKPSMTSRSQAERNMEGNIGESEDQQETEEVKELKEEHVMISIQEPKQGWTNVELRKQLAIGINEVTRALERDMLCLVLVCKSVKPPLMTHHLIQLSVSRQVPACQVPHLSETVAPVLGLKSVLALGFKKNSEAFTETVNAITPQVPPLNVSWIQQSKVVVNAEELDTNVEDCTGEIPKLEVTETALPQSQKRKFSEVSSNDTPTSKAIGVTLLPLKVKKIVPNPNKIRKPKKNKKNK